MKRAFAIVLVLATSSGCELERTTEEDFESELTDSLADSLRAVSDASDAGTIGPGFAGGDAPGCDATTQIQASQPLCLTTYPSQVRVTWSCVGANGNGASGTADVSTTLVPDACPVTELNGTQSLTLERRWQLGDVVATLNGTAGLSWLHTVGYPARPRSVTVDLDHRVARRDEVLRHQLVAGTRTVALDENGLGEADDTRVVDGELDVDFVLAEVHADVTETDLTFRRGCCHPISGALSYTLTGAEERSGSIVFGPTCGAAETDEGRPLELAPCVVD